jgi:SAM-dependent methyltransferase
VFDINEYIHSKDTIKAIAEIGGVLKPEGVAIMTTPNPNYFNDWAFDLTHINVRPPRFWRLMLEECDFDVNMSHVPSFIKYYMKNQIPSPDSVRFLVEEPLRYMRRYCYEKKWGAISCREKVI